jgi:hypothetical protein
VTIPRDPSENTHAVPAALKWWFIAHFAIDVLIAVPLFIAPREVLQAFGWNAVDPMAARLAAAALFGIGIESLLVRNGSPEAFRGMLKLKLLWSAFGAVGLAWSTMEGALRQSGVGWALAGVFAAFHALWWYWYLRLRRE